MASALGADSSTSAENLSISAPRLNEILKNRVEKVSVDYLLGICAKLGLSVTLKPVA